MQQSTGRASKPRPKTKYDERFAAAARALTAETSARVKAERARQQGGAR